MTPLRWGLSILALIVVFLAIVFFNPLTGFLMRQVETAKAGTETAVDTAVGAQEGALAQADVEKAATNVYLTVQNATEATHALELEARSAPDASAPLDPDRAERLRCHDQFLLRLRDGRGPGGGSGGAPEGGDSSGGPAVLPDLCPTAQPDGG